VQGKVVANPIAYEIYYYGFSDGVGIMQSSVFWRLYE
jgi:hypothetical protein